MSQYNLCPPSYFMGFLFLASPVDLPSLFSALLFTVAAKLAYDLLKQNSRSDSLPYPPGPKPKFLIGNALDFPKYNAHRVFAEWGRKYNSDIVHASAFGNHVVVINSLEMAEELFERRAQLYSDRPVIPITELLGWDHNVALLRYGGVWRQHRKMCWQHFNDNAARKYHSIERERVHLFLRSVLQEPDRVFDHNTLMSISIAMLMMYGYAPESLDDPVIHIAEEGTTLGASLVEPGSTLINVLPILRHIPSWIPGTTAKKMADRTRWLTDEMKRIPMERVSAAMKAGTAAPSLVTEFLEKKFTIGATPDEEAVVNNIAWTVYGAASDTTISAIGIFLYLIAKNPHVQKKAQEEIDRVIGHNRLPDVNDRHDLPYIEAIYRELLRYEPPISLGIPHSLIEDDIFNGYFLPKGTMISANIWAMTHDESVYPDPFAFRPERFFNVEGTLNDDSRILAYGFGRRICVGKAVASDMTWLIIASFLACFNISKAKDDLSNEIEFDDSFTEFGVVLHKKPFKCSITPRSEQIQQVIESTGNY